MHYGPPDSPLPQSVRPFVGLDELVPGKEVFKLREHVARVEYRVDDVPPHWDVLPCESSDENE